MTVNVGESDGYYSLAISCFALIISGISFYWQFLRLKISLICNVVENHSYVDNKATELAFQIVLSNEGNKPILISQIDIYTKLSDSGRMGYKAAVLDQKMPYLISPEQVIAFTVVTNNDFYNLIKTRHYNAETDTSSAQVDLEFRLIKSGKQNTYFIPVMNITTNYNDPPQRSYIIPGNWWSQDILKNDFRLD